jgi:hypothetical protein
MSELKRLVLDYRTGELAVRCLYRTKGSAGPNTKARRRQVEELVCEGLRQALDSLEGSEGDAELVGCSGFSVREDVLLVDAREEGSAA